MDVKNSLQVATLGGGCFWCLEAVFDDLQGVTDVVSGYCNGKVVNPTYKQVCGGDTGHAEVVKVTFDPSVISFVEILGVFFSIHDPTTLNRQGNDVGTQYRSGVYTHSDEQARLAHETIAHLTSEQLWPKPIVTEVVPAGVFYEAEEYHQEYFARNPEQGYCMAVISPKLSKFRQEFVRRSKSKV
jgi:peptide-methionine (S)-S-oxide reductase